MHVYDSASNGFSGKQNKTGSAKTFKQKHTCLMKEVLKSLLAYRLKKNQPSKFSYPFIESLVFLRTSSYVELIKFQGINLGTQGKSLIMQICKTREPAVFQVWSTKSHLQSQSWGQQYFQKIYHPMNAQSAHVGVCVCVCVCVCVFQLLFDEFKLQ